MKFTPPCRSLNTQLYKYVYVLVYSLADFSRNSHFSYFTTSSQISSGVLRLFVSVNHLNVYKSVVDTS